MSTKKALMMVSMWIGIAMLFNIGIYYTLGAEKALEFLGGYVIELSLSMDNLFLFLIIFSSFGIESKYQKRILTYGIMGAIVLRLIFILMGVTIVNSFHWILYVFGIVLIISGIKMFGKEEKVDVKESKILKLLSKIIPISEKIEGEKFFIREKGILYATPLFAVLFFIEISDVIFAIDSIPAIFSITTNTFIVYTSNIFAIMGLRSMYFLLEKLSNMFKYVKYGVALILIFVGIKLSILYFNIEISTGVSLAVVFTILITSIVISAVLKDKPKVTAS